MDRYDLCDPASVEACVYLADHCSQLPKYNHSVWAVLHTTNMPFHEVHTEDDWLFYPSSLGK